MLKKEKLYESPVNLGPLDSEIKLNKEVQDISNGLSRVSTVFELLNSIALNDAFGRENQASSFDPISSLSTFLRKFKNRRGLKKLNDKLSAGSSETFKFLYQVTKRILESDSLLEDDIKETINETLNQEPFKTQYFTARRIFEIEMYAGDAIFDASEEGIEELAKFIADPFTRTLLKLVPSGNSQSIERSFIDRLLEDLSKGIKKTCLNGTEKASIDELKTIILERLEQYESYKSSRKRIETKKKILSYSDILQGLNERSLANSYNGNLEGLEALERVLADSKKAILEISDRKRFRQNLVTTARDFLAVDTEYQALIKQIAPLSQDREKLFVQLRDFGEASSLEEQLAKDCLELLSTKKDRGKYMDPVTAVQEIIRRKKYTAARNRVIEAREIENRAKEVEERAHAQDDRAILAFKSLLVCSESEYEAATDEFAQSLVPYINQFQRIRLRMAFSNVKDDIDQSARDVLIPKLLKALDKRDWSQYNSSGEKIAELNKIVKAAARATAKNKYDSINRSVSRDRLVSTLELVKLYMKDPFNGDLLTFLTKFLSAKGTFDRISVMKEFLDKPLSEPDHIDDITHKFIYDLFDLIIKHKWTEDLLGDSEEATRKRRIKIRRFIKDEIYKRGSFFAKFRIDFSTKRSEDKKLEKEKLDCRNKIVQCTDALHKENSEAYLKSVKLAVKLMSVSQAKRKADDDFYIDAIREYREAVEAHGSQSTSNMNGAINSYIHACDQLRNLYKEELAAGLPFKLSILSKAKIFLSQLLLIGDALKLLKEKNTKINDDDLRKEFDRMIEENRVSEDYQELFRINSELFGKEVGKLQKHDRRAFTLLVSAANAIRNSRCTNNDEQYEYAHKASIDCLKKMRLWYQKLGDEDKSKIDEIHLGISKAASKFYGKMVEMNIFRFEADTQTIFIDLALLSAYRDMPGLLNTLVALKEDNLDFAMSQIASSLSLDKPLKPLRDMQIS